MNSNNYLGMSLRREVIEAEERTTAELGAGPGAVRFISGTYRQHIELERRLAAFHGREAAMIFSSAYATTLGVLVPLINADTTVISDELNHNCIINAMRLARPKDKQVYRHLDLADLDAKLAAAAGQCRRVIVVTDGIFSMRGDHAPLPEILEVCERHDREFPENVVLVVDDSHGIGALGRTGRGTEEYTGSRPVDILVGTLGKALGVNGGYVTGSKALCGYLRETAATYIYSNPSGGGAERAGDPRQPGGSAPAGPPARDDGPLRDRDRGPRLRDDPRRASGGAVDGAGHAEDQRPGEAPAGARHPGDRPQVPGGPPRRRGDPLPDLRRAHALRHRFHAEGAGELSGAGVGTTASPTRPPVGGDSLS
jgi:hypothetical protein